MEGRYKVFKTDPFSFQEMVGRMKDDVARGVKSSFARIGWLDRSKKIRAEGTKGKIERVICTAANELTLQSWTPSFDDFIADDWVLLIYADQKCKETPPLSLNLNRIPEDNTLSRQENLTQQGISAAIRGDFKKALGALMQEHFPQRGDSENRAVMLMMIDDFKS